MISLSEKAALLTGILSEETAHNGPVFVTAHLTSRCNLTCSFCRFHSPTSEEAVEPDDVRDIPLEMLKDFLSDLEEMRTREIVFSGEGEPLLYPDFYEAVAAAKATSMKVGVISNGTLLTREAIERLIKLRLDRLTISMWANREEEFLKLYPGTSPKMHRKVLDSMQLVSEMKRQAGSELPRVCMHRPICRTNVETLELAAQQARDLGCNRITFSPLRPWDPETPMEGFSPAETEQLIARLTHLRNRLNADGLSHDIDKALLIYETDEKTCFEVPCYVGWLYARLRIDGSVEPCGSSRLTVGNLSDSSFREIWDGQPYREFRRAAATREGFSEVAGACYCAFCRHLGNNQRIERRVRWVRPFSKLIRRFAG